MLSLSGTNLSIMKRIIILSLILFISIQNFAQLPQKILSSKQAHEDFLVFKNALMDGHPGLYWYSKEPKMMKTFDAVEEQLGDSLSYHSFFLLLNQVIEALGCGHTSINYPLSYSKKLFEQKVFLPFTLKEIDGRFYLTHSAYEELKVGIEILSIDGKPMKEILETFNFLTPLEKGITSKAKSSLELFFPYYYTAFINKSDKYRVKIKEKDGQERTLVMDAINWDDSFMFTSPRRYAAAQKPLDYKMEDKAVILTIRTLGNRNLSAAGINFEDTLHKIFTELKQRQTRKLVIDLRRNNGGTLYFSELLLSYLTDHPVKFYDRFMIREEIANGKFRYTKSPSLLKRIKKMYGPTKLENGFYTISKMDTIKPNQNRYDGKVVFITDGLSFSATSNFLAVCQNEKIGKIVGETPGGSFNGCNGGFPYKVHLPNSKMFLFFYVVGIHLNTPDSQSQIKVDYPVEYSLDDVLNNKDPFMDKAIQILQ